MSISYSSIAVVWLVGRVNHVISVYLIQTVAMVIAMNHGSVYVKVTGQVLTVI